MTCRTCRPWCATKEKQWHTRQHLITAGAVLAPNCPDCHSMEWATTKRYIVSASWPRGYVTLLVCLFLATLGILLAIVSARAEVCAAKINSNIERKAGWRWQYRTVDGKRCWYFSNNVLPREDLVWSYDSKEFDSDIDRVIERRFYKPVLDENQLLIENKP